MKFSINHFSIHTHIKLGNLIITNTVKYVKQTQILKNKAKKLINRFNIYLWINNNKNI